MADSPPPTSSPAVTPMDTESPPAAARPLGAPTPCESPSVARVNRGFASMALSSNDNKSSDRAPAHSSDTQSAASSSSSASRGRGGSRRGNRGNRSAAAPYAVRALQEATRGTSSRSRRISASASSRGREPAQSSSRRSATQGLTRSPKRVSRAWQPADEDAPSSSRHRAPARAPDTYAERASRAVPSSSAVKSRACAQTSDTHTLPRAPMTGGSHFEPDVKPARHSAFRPSVTGKRVTRRQPASNILPLPGIRPAPAVPIRRDNAPADFRSRFEDMHPWGCHLVDRPHFGPLSDDTVTSYLDAFVYKHVSQNGYFAARFVRSLFPRQFVGTPSVENPVPLPEVVRFVDTIAMRRQSAQVIEDLRNDTYVEDHLDVPRGPTGPPASCLFPPEYKGVRPVLYQVVYKGYGQGLILEAKDFLLFCPDRIELQCIVLDQYAVNTLSETTGFDREHVSIKDFVWVYAVGPTPRARAEPSEVLEGARRMRPTAFDVTTPFYFRATKYTFVTPPKDDRATLGIVLNVPRRGRDGDRVNNIRVAFEGYREAVTVSPKLCDFPIATAEPDQWLFGDMRHNSSTASRFSAAPVSKAAQSYLVNAIRVVLPAFPYETMTPLHVYRLSPAEEDWIRDREGVFRNYANDPREARRRMGKLFSASCAALSCTKLLNDDKTTRLVDASVPSLSSFPIRLVFELPNASADMGWNAHRPVDVWIVDSNTVLRMVIAQASYRFETRTLHVTLHTTISCHEHMRNLIDRFGRLQQRAVRVSACVRLGRLPIGTDPLFELLAEEEVFGTLHPSRDCRANAILNRLYDHRQAGADPDVAVPAQVPPAPMSVRLDNVPIDLRADQIHAVQMGDIDTPILAIQAAFGTGKTVVGALIAARLATADPEAIIVAMATTNGAVAQFTDTLLRLTDYRHLNVLRFVSDSALSDGCPQTAVDLHNILRQLPRDYRDQLSEAEFHTCQNYASCRQLVEIALFHPEQTMYLTEDQREDYRIAERENPEATEEAVEIMFRVRRPNILCITSASLLNSAGSLGLFGPYTKDCSVIIGDEASQIPEPVLVATSCWFPNARLIFIGDVHQLPPHIRTSPESVAARHGARGVMDLLLAKQDPVAPLLTTFRAHPALNDLPNSLFYDNHLVSGTLAAMRQMLVQRVHLPNSLVPFVFIDCPGTSQRAPSGSHSNASEARYCQDLASALMAHGISASSLAILVFYKDQQHLLASFSTSSGIALHTVDSIQGREYDVVILLSTRTDITPDTGAFLDDPLRLNVALTRCKHGQFVFGHPSSLSLLPNWSRLMDWASRLGLVVNLGALQSMFA